MKSWTSSWKSLVYTSVSNSLWTGCGAKLTSHVCSSLLAWQTSGRCLSHLRQARNVIQRRHNGWAYSCGHHGGCCRVLYSCCSTSAAAMKHLHEGSLLRCLWRLVASAPLTRTVALFIGKISEQNVEKQILNIIGQQVLVYRLEINQATFDSCRK